MSFVPAATLSAQMAAAPAARWLQAARPARPSIAAAAGAARDWIRPAPRRAPAARHTVPRRAGRDACGSATTSAGRPVVLVFAYYDCPMLCTLVINGLSSALRRDVARTRARISRSSRSASIRATRPRPRPPRKPVYLERYKRAGADAGWHFLTGDQPSDRSADQGRRLPLCLGSRKRSSSRTRPASSS